MRYWVLLIVLVGAEGDLLSAQNVSLDPRLAEAIEQMLEEVDHPDPRVRASHAETLGVLPEVVHFLDEVVPILLRLQVDPVPTVREKAMASLLQLWETLAPNPQVDAARWAAIDDPAPAVRQVGVRSLTRFERGHHKSCTEIRRTLEDGSPKVRIESLRAARKLFEPSEWMRSAQELRRDPDPAVRREAILAMAQAFRPASAGKAEVVWMVEALGDSDPGVRSSALGALLEVWPSVPQDAARRAFDHPSPAVRALVERMFVPEAWSSDPRAPGGHYLEPLLAETLKASESEVRVWAAAALGELSLSTEGTLQALREALEDPVVEVQLTVLAALAELRATDFETQGALVRALGDPVPEVASRAVEALQRVEVDSPELRERILAMLPDLDPSVAMKAGEILTGPGCGARSPKEVRALLAERERIELSGEWPGFVVVVPGDHPAQEIRRSTLSKIFLRKIRRWPAGEAVVPVDLGRCSPVRESFSRSVHLKSSRVILKYWQRRIFDRSVPPTELGSDHDVLRFVRKNPHSIGYVSSKIPLGPGVRTLEVVD